MTRVLTPDDDFVDCWLPVQTHMKPNAGREHEMSLDCWCCPTVEYVDPETGDQVVVHNREH